MEVKNISQPKPKTLRTLRCMLFETSYRNDKVRDQINELVGKPYSFLDRIRMGGTGSERMNIHDVSASFKAYLNSEVYTTVGSIELRPHGILIYFTQRLNHFTWAIPFWQLSLFKTNVLSIHAQGQFMKLELKPGRNVAFIQKLMEAKADFHKHQPRPSTSQLRKN